MVLDFNHNGEREREEYLGIGTNACSKIFFFGQGAFGHAGTGGKENREKKTFPWVNPPFFRYINF
jgi:hypothetical protein